MAANISKVGAQASISTEGFEDAIESVQKLRKSFMGLRHDMNKLAASWKGPGKSDLGSIGAGEGEKEKKAKEKSPESWVSRISQARRQIVAPLNAVRTAIISIAAIGALFGADKIANGIMDIGAAMFEADRQARHMGTRTEDLMAFQWAVKRVGEDATEGTYALHNLYDAFLSAGAGSRIATRAFAALGRTSFDLASTPIDVLNETVDALSRIDDYTKRVVATQTMFGDKAGTMIPLIAAIRARNSDALWRGGEQGGLSGLMKDPKNKGVAISADEVGVLRETARKFEDAALIFKGTWTQIAIGISPFAQMLTDFIEKQTRGGSLQGFGLEAAAHMLTIWERGSNAFKDLLSGVTGVSRALYGLITAIAIQAKAGLELLPQTDAGDSLIATWKEIAKSSLTKSAAIDLETAERDVGKYQPLGKGVNGHLEGNIAFLAAKLVPLISKDSWSGASRQMQAVHAENKSLIASALQQNISNAAPFEKYMEAMNGARAAQLAPRGPNGQALGAFGSDEMFGRAINKTLLDFEQSMGWHNVQLPTAIRQNTGAAESAVAKSKLEYDMQTVDTPQKRMERAQLAGNKTLEDIASYSKRVAEAAGQQKGAFPWQR